MINGYVQMWHPSSMILQCYIHIWTYIIGLSIRKFMWELLMCLHYEHDCLGTSLRLAETTTVRLATMLLVIHKHVMPIIPCGMLQKNCVGVEYTYSTRSQHAVEFTKTLGETIPLIVTQPQAEYRSVELAMRKLYRSWSICMYTDTNSFFAACLALDEYFQGAVQALSDLSLLAHPRQREIDWEKSHVCEWPAAL